jgi:TolB protein
VTVLTGSTSLAGTALAAFPGENGRLAFHSSMRAGNSDIFTVSPAGGTALNVTANPARDLDPAWSADGQRLAFSSDRTGDDEIYVREANGTLT